MNNIQQAVEQLYTALATVDHVQVFRGTGQVPDPPAVTVGPPKLTWQLPSSDPSHATFQVALVVAVSDYAMDVLNQFVPSVAAALDSPRSAVRESNAGLWRAGGTDLPAYLIDVDYAL